MRQVRVCFFLAIASGTTAVASAQYPTNNVTLLSHLTNSQIGESGEGADIWGWTDSQTNKDYALFASQSGTSFIDVTDGAHPVYLGRLPTFTGSSTWRDVKVYDDHAFVVSDGNGPHGMQVFDLTDLRGVTSPQTFSEVAHYSGFRNAHNIAINEDTGFAYVTGADVAAGGLHIVDISSPTQPTYAGQFATDGYSHDTQVVTYSGPDSNYTGREIAFSSNEDTLTIADVTNKSSTSMISRNGYPNDAYAHQGWLSEDQKYFFLGDELDEYFFGTDTRTHIFDVSDLDSVQYKGYFEHDDDAIDHNMYVKGNYIFQANYEAGVRILEISETATDVELTEVGYIDTFPSRTASNFNGAWSVYPYFGDGKFIISDINSGLFVAQFDLLVSDDDPDLNGDGDVDCEDIDLLTAAIAGGSTDAAFDLNGDGNVDLGDRDRWLESAGAANLASGNPYLLGDGNLDGDVDISDFNIWNGNKFTANSAWCSADFNADGNVDISDFNLWNSNKFQSSGTAAVPEPAGLLLLLLGASAISLVRRS